MEDFFKVTCKDNLTKAERNELRELVKVLEHQLAESEGDS